VTADVGPALPGAVVPFGDRAFLVETTDVAGAHALEAVLAGHLASGTAPGSVEEIVVGFASVLVVLDAHPDRAAAGVVAGWLEAVAGAPTGRAPVVGRRRDHVLPVVFDGADLNDVAGMVGTTPDRVVELLVGADLEVAFVGFAPGFPYLTGLPSELAALPRRSTPRTSVPTGSVAVAAGYASVYPRSTPGGWHLLGRTSERLFDPDVPPHSRVAPGDRVRFVATDAPAVTGATVRATSAGRPLLIAEGPCLEVLDPGLATTVQDGGRRGVAGIGVPAAGAADARSAALVNLLLGDDASTAVLECTALGPTLSVVGDGHLAVSGPGAVEVTVDGRPAPDGAVLPVADGQVVRVGRVGGGLRAYLGVAGGLVTPVLFGSRSSDVLAGLGPGPLRAGDRLARGVAGRIRGRLDRPARSPGGTVLRVVPGPHGTVDGLVGTEWEVGTDVDRIGVRLGPVRGPGADGGPARPSTPMVTGAVQVPPDGRPIILLPDHATVGGYPVVACVATVDLPLVGQLVPGDRVTFTSVDPPTAVALAGRDRADTTARVTGWYPIRAGT
jgi:KipI family sensor histidine kinase inhibitor